MCCVTIIALGEKNIKELAEVIVRGLLGFIGLEGIHKFLSRIANIILASLIKLITAAPDVIFPYALSLVPYFLKLCALCDDEGDVTLHLMGLQCLISINNLPSTRKGCKALRSMVTSHIASAVDHLSHTVRQAEVQVRNE